MSYIGSTPTTQSFIAGTDYFNGTGAQVAFTLSRSVNSVNDIEVIVNNVEQIPSGYSVSGTTLTFSAAPSAGTSNVYVRYLSTTNLSLAIPAGTSASFNTVTATSLTATNLTSTNGASIQGLTVGRGAGAVATNTAVGASALAANTTGSRMTALGYQAGNSNVTNSFSAYVGYRAGANVTGDLNVAIGDRALEGASGSTATQTVAIGQGVLGAVTSGNSMVGIGYSALLSNTSGTYNVAVGQDALRSNTTASNNTAVGYQAAYSNTTGTPIQAFGKWALYGNTTGTANNAFGFNALGSNTTGSSNSGFGDYALYSNTTGNNNTAVGYQVGYNNTTGGFNIFMGYQAGYFSNGGTNAANICIGTLAGYSLTTGSLNTFVGGSPITGGAGQSVTTGSKNTVIGSYNGNQGGLDIRTASNYIVLSDGDGNPRIFIAGTNGYFFPNIRSSADANNDLRFNTGNGELYYQTSSQRYKENIVDLEFDTSNLYNLRPVSYDDKATGNRCYGLIAEETFAQIPNVVVKRNIDGEILPDSIPYSMLSVVIINEMKKLKTLVDTQAAIITQLQSDVAALKGQA